MRFYEFILEDFKTAQLAFINQGADPEEVKTSIGIYRDLNKRNQFQGDEKNIDWWAKTGWGDFKQKVDIIAQTPTKTERKRSKIVGKAIEIESPSDNWEIYVPLDKEASCNIGKNTSWCTTKLTQNHFENYFYDRGVVLVYCIGQNEKNDTKYAMAMHKDLTEMEFFTKLDSSIKQKDFEARTGMDADLIKDRVMQHKKEITDEQKSANIKDPERALKYAIAQKVPFPEGEKAIASSGTTAYDYAEQILQSRFKLGEPMIARDPELATLYASRVIKGRWPEAEPIIMKDPKSAMNYAKWIIKGRWPEAEPTIAKEDAIALRYAVVILKGRFPEYEQYVLKRAASAWEYINHVIKGPWLEAEPILKTSYNYQLQYEKLIGRKI